MAELTSLLADIAFSCRGRLLSDKVDKESTNHMPRESMQKQTLAVVPMTMSPVECQYIGRMGTALLSLGRFDAIACECLAVRIQQSPYMIRTAAIDGNNNNHQA